MKRLGKELEFISWIRRNGSGTNPVDADHILLMHNEQFNITCLSLSEKTYIASGFNSFVVRLKEVNELNANKLELTCGGTDLEISPIDSYKELRMALRYSEDYISADLSIDDAKKIVDFLNKNIEIDKQ